MFWKKKEAKITVNYKDWAALTDRVEHNNRQIEELAGAVISLESKVSELVAGDEKFKTGLVELINSPGSYSSYVRKWAGAECACSPVGEPHSDNCKAAGW